MNLCNVAKPQMTRDETSNRPIERRELGISHEVNEKTIEQEVTQSNSLRKSIG